VVRVTISLDTDEVVRLFDEKAPSRVERNAGALY
jgi:hypothetical protein